MGEREFEQWCAQAGLIANRAEVDKGGWDYLVQFKAVTPSPQVTSLDHLPPSATCWIQVKSTDARKRASPSVKLSNWLRLIDPSLPAFHLVLRFEGQEHPVEAYLVPVGESAVFSVLKKLRSLPIEDIGALHKSTLSVAMRPEHRLPACNGLSLRAGIEQHVGTDLRAYHEAKKQWHDKSGYEGARYRFTMTTVGSSDAHVLDRLVDFAIGLTDELPSTIRELEEIRFGVAKPVTTIVPLPSEVIIRTSRPSLDGTLEVAVPDGTLRVRVPCRFYHPHNLFPFIPNEKLRFRVATSHFELVFRAQGEQVSLLFHMPTAEEPKRLSDWSSAFRVIRMIEDVSVPLSVLLDVGGAKLVTTFHAGRGFRLDELQRKIADAALNADAVARALAIDPSTAVVTRAELLGSHEYLAQSALVLTTDLTKVVISGEVDVSAPDGLQAGYAMVVAAPIGRTLYMVGLAYYGKLEYEAVSDKRKRFHLRNPERKTVFVETVELQSRQS